MPRIPLMNTQTNSPNVPDLGQGPSIARAGQSWDAVSRLGNAISNVGNDIAAMRKEAEHNTFMASAKADIDRQTAEKEKELDAKYAGKDPTGYASEMNEFLNDLGTNIMESAPRESVRASFANRFSEMSNNIGMNAQAKEDRNRAYFQSSLIEQSSRKDRAFLVENPSAEKASTFYANTVEAIKGGTGLFFDPHTANQMLKKEAENYGHAYLEGAIQNKRYKEIVRFADGKDPNGKVLHENIDPSILQKYKGEALRKMESEGELSKMVLGKQLNDFTNAAFTGRKISSDEVNILKSKISTLKPEEAAYALDDLHTTLAYSEKLQEAKGLKISEIQQAQAFGIDHGDSNFNLTNRMAAQKRFESGLKEIITEKINKPGDFYAQHDNEIGNLSKQALDLNNPQAMRDFAETVTLKNKQEGGPGDKILTTEMSKNYSSLLKSKNPKTVSQVRDALANGFGEEHFGKAISNMVANGDIKEDMALAMYIPNESLRVKMIDNINNKETVEAGWQQRATGEVKTSMKEMYQDESFLSIKKAIQASGKGNANIWLTNSMESNMELQYKSAIKSGATPKEAKAEALSIIAGSYGTASVDKSNVIIPKSMEQYKSQVEDFMASSLSTNSLSSMDIAIPKEYSQSDLMIGKSNEEVKQKYIEDTVKSGRWISNYSQTGAKLMKVNEFGENVPVRDSTGNIIERSFKDMRPEGISYNEEIANYKLEIDSLKEEAKTSASAAGRIGILQMNISRLNKEQSKRRF